MVYTLRRDGRTHVRSYVKFPSSYRDIPPFSSAAQGRYQPLDLQYLGSFRNFCLPTCWLFLQCIDALTMIRHFNLYHMSNHLKHLTRKVVIPKSHPDEPRICLAPDHFSQILRFTQYSSWYEIHLNLKSQKVHIFSCLRCTCLLSSLYIEKNLRIQILIWFILYWPISFQIYFFSLTENQFSAAEWSGKLCFTSGILSANWDASFLRGENKVWFCSVCHWF